MITNFFMGQIGNQLFQSFTTIAHALKLGVPFAFPPVSGKRGQFPFMFQKEFPIIDIETDWHYSNLPVYREKRFGIYDPIPLEDNLCLRGYWQHWQYFHAYKDEIKLMFDMPVLDFPIEENLVSLHIRRGDSLRHIEKLPQPTDKYLNEAMEHFPDSKFLVFSDDMDWCRQRFKGDRFIFTEDPRGAKDDLMLMAKCKHNIIVNSTFSWWGAYWGDSSERMVICPHVESWFGDRYKHFLSAEGLICPWWTQIKY